MDEEDPQPFGVEDDGRFPALLVATPVKDVVIIEIPMKLDKSISFPRLSCPFLLVGELRGKLFLLEIKLSPKKKTLARCG